MRHSADLLKAVNEAIVDAGLQGTSILVAVSGGPDSLALLHALHSLKDQIGIDRLIVAHFDHGFRGAQSAAEAEFVSQYCHKLEVDCHVGSAAAESIAATNKGSLQEAARTARYAFLDSVADAVGASCVATAHNRDDQVETLLINILRGSGLDGLRGIPRRAGRYVRPLLDVDRATIEAYCAEHDLEPRRDPSNDDPTHYLRNRIRLELMPLLERDYHPTVRDFLLRLSNTAAIDNAYVDDQAHAALLTVLEGDTLDAAALNALPHAIQRRVVRLAVERVRGTREGLTENHVERALALADGQPGASGFTIPSPTCRVHISNGRLIFDVSPTAIASPSYWVVLTVPSTIVLDSGWSISASLEPMASAQHMATMDADKIDLSTLVVRSRESGDRIDPLGMGGKTKKLQDVFVDGKVPRGERTRWPVVADDNGPLWVPGLTQCERAKLSEASTRSLYLIATTLTQSNLKQ